MFRIFVFYLMGGVGREGEVRGSGKGIGSIKLNCNSVRVLLESTHSVHIMINVIISMTVKRLSLMIGGKEPGPHVGVGSLGFLVIM